MDVKNNVTVPPSNKARKARIRKGAVFPTNSYITLPNGGPTVEDTLDGQLWRDQRCKSLQLSPPKETAPVATTTASGSL